MPPATCAQGHACGSKSHACSPWRTTSRYPLPSPAEVVGDRPQKQYYCWSSQHPAFEKARERERGSGGSHSWVAGQGCVRSRVAGLRSSLLRGFQGSLPHQIRSRVDRWGDALSQVRDPAAPMYASSTRLWSHGWVWGRPPRSQAPAGLIPRLRWGPWCHQLNVAGVGGGPCFHCPRISE